MANLLNSIEKTILDNNLLSNNSTIIIGLSGGPDSVFLTHILAQLRKKYNWKLVAAHLNHGWRQESDQDEKFCENLCREIQVEFVRAHAQDIVLDKKFNGSKEEMGRLKRRTFFENIANTCGVYPAMFAEASPEGWKLVEGTVQGGPSIHPSSLKAAKGTQGERATIALAHHADDQIETFFIRLLRGAGVEGLSCMRVQEGLYVRPLLNISKQEILDYLHENNIAYCIDNSNTSFDYLRNRIRHNVIPVLHETDKRFSRNCLKAIEHLRATDTFIEKCAQEAARECIQNNQLSIDKYFLLDSLIRQRLILNWLISHDVPFTPSIKFFNEIERFMCNTKSACHQMHPSWGLEKKEKILSLDTKITS